MQALNNTTHRKESDYRFKILQFGEGNFLRAFVDWIIHKSNKQLGTQNGIVVVQPLERGMAADLKQQDQLYHVILQGIKKGQPVRETELIDCIMDAVNPYTDYEAYKSYMLNPELELVVSNTTEAGISRVEHEDINARPPRSFPGKVTQLLFQRYKHFNGAADKGLTFLCCELIEKNATVLKEIILELAASHELEQGFIDWLNHSCSFCSTLVDRIVPGFPRDNIKAVQAELNYEDKLVVMGEFFHLWAIEAPLHVRNKFPFDKAGLNVVWLDDMTKFRDKKVRILNGSHTALVPIGLLKGYQTVKEAFEDETIASFITGMVAEEVIPNIEGDKKALKQFADEILERFFNPFIRHFLKDISLNSLSKWMTRDYPSLLDSYRREGKVPQRLSLSLSALIVLYRGEYKGLKFAVNDNAEHVKFIRKVWENTQSYDDLTAQILSNKSIWIEDLMSIDGLKEEVSGHINEIMTNGIQAALEKTI